MKLTYKHTKYASYLGYIMQAIVNNLPPRLFVTFQREFGIPLSKIGFLISMNFCAQILIDWLGAKYADKIGYRRSIVFAHVMASAGLILLGVLPYCMDPFAGIVIAMLCNAVGGGLAEVLVSPIVESLPGDEKASAMSILHSFYCWGFMAVVLLSTLWFVTVGTANWRYLPMLWALIPLFNVWFFSRVPMRVLVEEGEALPMKKLFSQKLFWILFVLMVCSGAAEISMSQWSSVFAELGLGVSKTVGDLLGPCAFALFQGIARAIYGKFGAKLDLRKFITVSAILCFLMYLTASLSPFPLLSLVGCALCGFSVGIFWPGTFSLAAEACPAGGTAMFALLALAGDLGAAVGPGVVGAVSETAGSGFLSLFSASGENAGLKAGILAAVIFPIGILVFLKFLPKNSKKDT